MNFNKISVAIVAIGVVLLVGIFIAYKLLLSPAAAPSSGNNTGTNTEVPGGGGTTVVNTPGADGSTTQNVDTKSVAASGGGSVIVKDFLKDKATVKDPINDNHYFIGPHPYEGVEDASASDAPPYVIEYIETDQSFTISLMQEPLAQTRSDMEQFLMSKLGVTQSDMCHLNYLVSVPTRVNAYFAGYSLGFSFCPDAVAF